MLSHLAAPKRIRNRHLLNVAVVTPLILGVVGGCVATTPGVKVAGGSLPALVAAVGPPGEKVGALVVSNPEQLLGGVVAAGRPGDLLLYNDRVRVVVSGVGHHPGLALSGGNIIDLDRGSLGTDELGEIYTYLDDTFPRQLVYEQVVVTASGEGGIAEITAVGRDSMAPSVVGRTRYTLAPGQDYVTVVTELENTGLDTLEGYEVGDAIQWGRTDHFAPGYGTDIAGKSTQGGWIAGVGEGLSYAVTALAGTLKSFHGNAWSDVITGKVDLAPGGIANFERYVVVGTGDVASMLPTIHQLRQEVVREVKGSVVEVQAPAQTGKGGDKTPDGAEFRVQGAEVEAVFSRSGRPYATARTGLQGEFSLLLPPDEYQLVVRHRSRQAQSSARVDLISGEAGPQRLEVSPPGKLRYHVTGEGGQPLPSKLTLVGIAATPDPTLGPRWRSGGALNVILSPTGQGEMDVPPGVYRITASRGIEYGVVTEEVTIPFGDKGVFSGTLLREVKTPGYLSADLHQSSRYSPECVVEPYDVLVANLAEGVELVVGADDGIIPDYSAALARLPGVDVKVIPGVVLNVEGLGSVSVFPMAPRPGSKGNGAPDISTRDPGALFKAMGSSSGTRVVQVNHPRDGTRGYFDLFGLDAMTGQSSNPAMDFGFNTLEVVSGKRLRDASTVLRDWFLLLNQGYTMVAVGASDSHTTVTQERGYPRTFIGVGSDSPAQVGDDKVVKSLISSRNVVVTNGPFIQVKVGERGGIGDLVSLPGGHVVMTVEVQAPRWVQVDRVEIIANGEVIRTLDTTAPDGVLKLKTREEFVVPRDTWFVVVARGSRGMDPVVPQYKGTTITPLGFTNPVWVDVDGDGAFDPLIPPLGRGGSPIPLKKAAP